MKESILVTGGAGYVGSTLVPLLLRNGYKIKLLDHFQYGYAGIVHVLSEDNLTVVKGDIRNEKIVEAAMDGMDYVIHLAAIVGYPACRKDPALSRSINVDGTKILVNSADRKVPFIFASTGSTYGKLIERYCTETSPLNPVSDYGRQKADAEEIVKTNSNFVIYRFATAFGVSPRMRLDLLPNDFTYKAVKDKTLIIYEKEFMRTFIHVKDMARAFLFALENYPKIKGEVYNVGDEHMNYSKEQVANILRKKVEFYLHFADVGHDVDQRDYKVSYEKIKSVGFNCEWTMERGLDDLIKFFNIVEIPTPFANA